MRENFLRGMLKQSISTVLSQMKVVFECAMVIDVEQLTCGSDENGTYIRLGSSNFVHIFNG